jgi:arylsulfatase A-like enzyme
MGARRAICIVVDGLRADALGTYGNTSYETPQLDALAARSSVVEWLWADSPELADFYHAAWSGVVADRSGDTKLDATLFTDEPWLLAHADCLVGETLSLERISTTSPAADIEDTALGRFFSAAIHVLQQWQAARAQDSEPRLCWIHSQGMFGPWDAPLAMREELLDVEDPPVDASIGLPQAVEPIDDPDLMLQYHVAYAAQVKLLDACLGALLQAIDDTGNSLVMLTSSRGMALGEHGVIGADAAALYGERLHLPWVVHESGNRKPCPRISGLAGPADLAATLRDWFSLESTQMPNEAFSLLPLLASGGDAPREQVVSCRGNDEQSIRTSEWFLRCRQNAETTESGVELYAKPDDRYEQNDVVSRCPHEVEQLTASMLHAPGEPQENCPGS